MNRILAHFSLTGEQEDFPAISEKIDDGVEFRGTNLWLLVFAIFIASLGLNVNSTAVVIGAMLISPLMGPILGLGFSMAVSDIALLKKSIVNYLFAFVVGLITSTVFFSLSPLSDASSEILARTSPNIYDVLIALFGGFAGMLAMCSRNKGNVIPGVAIATALMPPLCTAGFGLANWKPAFLLGALYLFIINTVFISLATLLTARVMQFPRKHLADARAETMAARVMWGVVLVTLLPSIYFGYDIVVQNNFKRAADRFIDTEAVFPNDYLLKRSVDPRKRTIVLTYGGQTIAEDEIAALRAKLDKYDIAGTELKIQQGFSILSAAKEDGANKQDLDNLLAQREKELQDLKDQVAKERSAEELGKKIYQELKAQYPNISSAVVEQVMENSDEGSAPVWYAVISSDTTISTADQRRISEFLRVRMPADDVTVNFEAATPRPTPSPAIQPSPSN
jgi:uncharacterized hydrophobic protein (TIGR00271 family)